MIKGQPYHFEEIELTYENSNVIDSSIAKQNLLDFKTILDKNNVKFLLMHGTLLGAIREQNFIKHDIDIDTCTLEEEKAKKEKEKAEKKKDKKDAKTKDTKKEEDKKKEEVKPLTFDLENRFDRIVRLTVNSSRLSDAVLTPKGDVLYYLAAFEGDYDLWEHKLKENTTKILLKGVGGGALIPDKEGKNIFMCTRS